MELQNMSARGAVISLDAPIVRLAIAMWVFCAALFGAYLGWLGLTIVEVKVAVADIGVTSERVEKLTRRVDRLEYRLDTSTMIGRVPSNQ